MSVQHIQICLVKTLEKKESFKKTFKGRDVRDQGEHKFQHETRDVKKKLDELKHSINPIELVCFFNGTQSIQSHLPRQMKVQNVKANLTFMQLKLETRDF